jgi:hypothetical protein
MTDTYKRGTLTRLASLSLVLCAVKSAINQKLLYILRQITRNRADEMHTSDLAHHTQQRRIFRPSGSKQTNTTSFVKAPKTNRGRFVL